MTDRLSVVVDGAGPRTYVTEVFAPAPVAELQRLHSPMKEPELEPEAGA